MVAFLVVLLEGLSFGATLPVTGYYVVSFHGGAFETGLLFALVSGPRVITNPICGTLSDRYGRRPFLILTTLGTIAGSVLWAISSSLGMLAVSRAVTGLSGAQAVLAHAVAADVSTPQRRAASLGLLGAAFGVALTLGPLIGGLVGSRWSYAAVGWACAAMQCISLALILFAMGETAAGPSDRVPEAPRPDARARYWAAIRLVIVGGLLTLGLTQLLGTAAPVSQRRFHLMERDVGFLLAFVGLVTAAVQGGFVGRGVQRFGERRVTQAGLLLFAAGLAVLTPELPGWAALIGVGLAAVGSGLAMPSITASLSQLTSAINQGRVLGLNQSALGVARAAGFILGGWLCDRLGTGAPFASAGLIALIAFWVLPSMGAAAWGSPAPAAADSA